MAEAEVHVGTHAGQPHVEARRSAVGGRRWAKRTAWLRDQIGCWLFVLPFLAAYVTFMIFPFFKNLWISTYSWNLLEVAFNPDAKTFVGIGNYVNTLWGRRIEWDLLNLLDVRLVLLALVLLIALGWRRRWWSGGTALLLGLVLVGAALLMGLHPGGKGRWSDRSFWIAVRNTLVFVAASVPVITAFSLALAVFLNHDSRAMAALRTVFYVPSVLSVTVITLIWTYMFSPFQGLIGNVFRAFGAEPLVWLTNPDLAMPSIVIATVWWVLGFPMIVLLAGLQEIPTERYEAARLDGANVLDLFRHITLPGLKRPLTFVILYQVISQFQIFGQAQLMTQGGPGEATNTLVRYLYMTGFRDNELGRAAAMAFLLFALMALASFLYLRLQSRSEED